MVTWVLQGIFRVWGLGRPAAPPKVPLGVPFRGYYKAPRLFSGFVLICLFRV